MRTKGRGLFALAAALAACATPPPPAPARPPPPPLAAPPAEVPREIQLGPIVLTLSDARTAQVFHIVDRLSKWQASAGAHAEYETWAETAMPLDDGERAMLAAHAKLRARRGRGALDQAFYVDDAIDVAAREASDEKLLTPADADAERALLEHFAPRLRGLLEEQQATVHALELAVAKEALLAAPVAAQLGRFCETEGTLEVHAFLVADPSKTSGGGALHGSRLVVEVIPGEDNVPTFFHELLHAVLDRRRGSIAIAAQKCDEPVDPETLQEGLAYAVAPGLVHEAGRDVLLGMVSADQGGSLSDPTVRAERLGLALRTELASALEGGHEALGAFLPKTCDAWGKLVKP